MKTLTIFTPTYNRAYCLGQCYESLLNQTSKDFVWLIIDDGSTDNTKNLVESWMRKKHISIQYHYQNNQGMHGGHNSAYTLIKTPLNVCIDSDDYMPEEAVEKIISCWPKIKNNRNIAGIVGLDADKYGNIIGTKLPYGLTECTLSKLYHLHGIKGDKKLVYKTEIIKQFQSYPIFEGEKFVPLGTLYLLIDQHYSLKILNEILCIVEYLPDGSSLNILKQYRLNPKGFLYSREVAIKYGIKFGQKFKNSIHYISSKIQLKDFSFLWRSPNLLLTYFAMIPGIILYFYIRIKTFREIK